MSHPNTDRDENINLIRARQRARPKHGTIAHLEAVEDIQYLLSLLDSQADDKEFAARTPIGIQIATNAATRMRDACVEEVRRKADSYQKDSERSDYLSNYRKKMALAASVLREVANDLESLTLDDKENQ